LTVEKPGIKGDHRAGVLLGSGPAGVVAALILRGLRAPKIDRSCRGDPPDVLLRFSYPDGRAVDASLVDFDCPRGSREVAQSAAIFFGNDARTADASLTNFLIPDASAYTVRKPPTVPDLFGYSLAKTIEVARTAGFGVDASEETDAGFAPEVVMLQYPPAGTGDIGNGIDLMLSVPPSRPCRANDLALVYDGYQGATGNFAGSISIWDVSARFCQLEAPLTLVGTDASGRAVTRALKYDVEPQTVLSPHARPQAPGGPSVGEFVSEVGFVTPTTPNCPAGQTATTTPTRWRLSLLGGSLSVVNAGGLSGSAFPVDCDGRIATLGPAA
jgi:hypothetical protein